uniref:ATS domain-containing protein n=1 Tax=Strongyloides venezuelensis TaxID=75913 RepID=A0A0K0F1S1_STRVS
MVYVINEKKRKYCGEEVDDNDNGRSCNGYEVLSKLTELVENIGTSNYIPQIKNCLDEDYKTPSKKKCTKRFKPYISNTMIIKYATNNDFYINDNNFLPTKHILHHNLSSGTFVYPFSMVRLLQLMMRTSNRI